MIIVLDIAFDILKVREVKTDVKEDNLMLQKLLQKFGFAREEEHIMRGHRYIHFSLQATNRDYQQLNEIVKLRADASGQKRPSGL